MAASTIAALRSSPVNLCATLILVVTKLVDTKTCTLSISSLGRSHPCYNRTMSLFKLRVLGLSALLAAAAEPIAAQDAPSKSPAGIRDAFLSQLKDVEGKIADLTVETAQENDSWHAATGVRSVSGVVAH